MSPRRPDIQARCVFKQLFRSRGEGCAAKGAGLLHALLPKLLHAVSVKFMFAGKSAQRTTRKRFQTDGAFAAIAFRISCPSWHYIAFIRYRCHQARSSFFRGDTESLVTVFPMLRLACLAAILSCFALRTCQLGTYRTTVDTIFKAGVGSIFLSVGYHVCHQLKRKRAGRSL